MTIKPTLLKEALHGKIPERALAKVRRAYDQVGTIAILEIPKGLEKYEKLIAKTLLESSPAIATVCKKAGGHTGIYRRQKIKILAGRRNKTTIHTEHGVKLKVHVEDTYFSPRLANERLRVANLVHPGERVLVMFSGIAPYPLVLAKISKATSITGIEINPKAHALALENLTLNKRFSNIITLYNGDVAAIVPTLHLKPKDSIDGIKNRFDRIIMPLPKGASGYLDVALSASKPGCIIHYYDFSPEGDIESVSPKVLKEIHELGKDARVLSTVKCGQSRVREYRVCVDLQII